jgi:hypothetical protein
MEEDAVRIDALKAQLREDPRYPSAAERCETYRAMFERTRYWREAEYRALGCGDDAS